MTSMNPTSPLNKEATSRTPRAAKSKAPTLRPGDCIGAGDTRLIPDVLPEEFSKIVFTKLRDEVKWDVMHHRGGEVPRLVAVEGEVGEDGRYVFSRISLRLAQSLTLAFQFTVTLPTSHHL